MPKADQTNTPRASSSGTYRLAHHPRRTDHPALLDAAGNAVATFALDATRAEIAAFLEDGGLTLHDDDTVTGTPICPPARVTDTPRSAAARKAQAPRRAARQPLPSNVVSLHTRSSETIEDIVRDVEDRKAKASADITAQLQEMCAILDERHRRAVQALLPLGYAMDGQTFADWKEIGQRMLGQRGRRL